VEGATTYWGGSGLLHFGEGALWALDVVDQRLLKVIPS
jgi:hypothetical protein